MSSERRCPILYRDNSKQLEMAEEVFGADSNEFTTMCIIGQLRYLPRPPMIAHQSLKYCQRCIGVGSSIFGNVDTRHTMNSRERQVRPMGKKVTWNTLTPNRSHDCDVSGNDRTSTLTYPHNQKRISHLTTPSASNKRTFIGGISYTSSSVHRCKAVQIIQGIYGHSFRTFSNKALEHVSRLLCTSAIQCIGWAGQVLRALHQFCRELRSHQSKSLLVAPIEE
eukprot:SAG31_NODE_2189_length_6232_cov_11.011740_1_plen_223_part_00